MIEIIEDFIKEEYGNEGLFGDKENIKYQDYGIESIKDASYKNFGMQSTSIIRLKYWSNFVFKA